MPEVQMPLHSRLAPTPSGFLHEGNAFNFVLTWLLLRKSGGTLRLRIDDYDLPRVRDEYIGDVFRLLDWLGLDWDKGPQSPDDHKKHFSSIHRTELYRSLLSGLRTSGLTYTCTCSKKELAKGACSCREEGKVVEVAGAGAVALAERMAVPAGACAGFTDLFQGTKKIAVTDFTLWRKDDLPAYQLASVADDTFYRTSFIVRGNDLLQSTAAQIYLAKKASIENFRQITFAHHPLITGAANEKLSKSAGSTALKNHYRNKQARELFYRKFCKWIGTGEEAVSAAGALLILPPKIFAGI